MYDVNTVRAHEMAMVDLAQRRIVALEDMIRFEARIQRVEIDLTTRTVRLYARGNADAWVHTWPTPDASRPTHNAREDRPHDLAAIIKATMRLVGFAMVVFVTRLV